MGGFGTGFLVGNSEKTKIYLVTNKHVLSKDPLKRKNATKIFFHFNKLDQHTNSIFGDKLEILLEAINYYENPNRDIDVMVFELNKIIPLLTERSAKIEGIPWSYLATKDLIEIYDIKISDEIIVIGYPFLQGLKHSNYNLPIIRQGIIATNIGELLEDVYKEKNEHKRTRSLRGFLIDGAVIPGSSGSPVILKPSLFRYINDSIVSDNFPPILLGIVSEYRYSYTEYFQSFANMGLVFDCNTIKETITSL